MKVFLQQLAANIKKTITITIGYPYSITIFIIGFFTLFFFLATEIRNFGFKNIATTMINDLEKSDKVRDSMINSYANVNNCTKALANQYNYIKFYKKQHVNVAKEFEVFYYAFVLILVISSVVSGLMGVLIAKNGWQHQSKSIRAAFIGFVFCASFSGVCMNVFNNAENASKNATQYFYFTNLQTNIYNVFGIADSLDKKCGDSSLIKVFCENNKNMKENMNLFLDIKADKVPTTDINTAIGGK